VKELPLHFKETILYLTQKLGREDMAVAANLMWCLWKARNGLIIENRPFRPLAIVRQARAMPITQLAGHQGAGRKDTFPYSVSASNEIMIVDASWEQSSKAGMAYVHY
jgi:hypothetical protein